MLDAAMFLGPSVSTTHDAWQESINKSFLSTDPPHCIITSQKRCQESVLAKVDSPKYQVLDMQGRTGGA